MASDTRKTEDDYAVLDGQVLTTLNLGSLAKAVRQFSVACRIGESSHYTGGHYLHISRGKAELTFDRIKETEYLVGGEAPSVAEMNQLAEGISNVLQRLALKHRFEVYFPYEQSKLVSYFHHDWPLN